MVEYAGTGNQKKVSIIVSNYQGMKYLPDFFLHLMSQTYRDYEVIFVDAGSEDGSAQYVSAHYPEVVVVRAGRIGIGEAVNLGMQRASGEILMFDLNTDEYVEPEWLYEMVCMLEAHDFRIIAGTMRIIHGTDLIDEAGVNLNRCGQAVKLGHNQRMRDYNLSQEPVVFVGCPAFHRRILEQVGMVDENYFIYAEDLDFCFRAGRLGISTWCATKARSHHHVRGTIGSSSRHLEYYLRRANLRFHLIHSRPVQIVVNWLYIAVFLLLSAFAVSIMGTDKSPTYREKFWGRFKAVIWNLHNLKKSLETRRDYKHRENAQDQGYTNRNKRC
jgi:GT2 family glycosyltransferase